MAKICWNSTLNQMIETRNMVIYQSKLFTQRVNRHHRTVSYPPPWSEELVQKQQDFAGPFVVQILRSGPGMGSAPLICDTRCATQRLFGAVWSWLVVLKTWSWFGLTSCSFLACCFSFLRDVYMFLLDISSFGRTGKTMFSGKPGFWCQLFPGYGGIGCILYNLYIIIQVIISI